MLERGELTVEGRITSASNATLYCRVELDGVAAACVYKPVAGERPLWDYPDGTLAEREVAAYLVGRRDRLGHRAADRAARRPAGHRHGPAVDRRGRVVRHRRRDQRRPVRRCSGSRCWTRWSTTPTARSRTCCRSRGPAGLHVYGVDHGVSFGVTNKLRTVLWQWAGDPIPEEGLDVLRRLADRLERGLGEQLGELLTTRRGAAHPPPGAAAAAQGDGSRMPPTDWPAIPYPPY